MANHSQAIQQRTIVTIVTHSFLIYAQALRTAIRSFDDSIGFVALVTDNPPGHHQLPDWTITPTDLSNTLPRARQIFEKYSTPEQSDLLRWSLKSQLLAFALQGGGKQVLWCDPDLMFFESPNLLFQMLESDTVLLSPHNRAVRPSVDESNFQKNFTEGVFQAGFVGVGQDTAEFLDWWSEVCLWTMCKDRNAGLWDDQKFLDLVPVFWSGTKILRHRGCNLAEWNRSECIRSLDSGSVVISGIDTVIFIHFTDCTVKEILKGTDTILRPFLDEYLRILRNIDPDFQPRLPQANLPKRTSDRTTKSQLSTIARWVRAFQRRISRNKTTTKDSPCVTRND